MRARAEAVSQWATRATDARGLAAFRVLFGLVGLIGALRFFAYGWIDRFFVAPTTYFHFYGFEFVEPLGRTGMHLVFAGIALASLLVALGLFYRIAIVAFFVLFTYVELLDVSNYLNHYVLVSLLALWMSFMPLGRTWGLDAHRRPERRLTHLPRWMSASLQLQVACVYVFAALAKVSGDWLLHGQPLELWLAARADTVGIGWLAEQSWAPLAMSWAGFAFDLTIPLWLSWRRTRAVAYVVLLSFHAATSALFTIGMFPLIMSVAATVFFSPRWPARVLRLRGRQTYEPPRALRFAIPALIALALLQVAVPLRAHAYGGDVLWHEQGMRFSWRVLCREKNGSVTFRARVPGRPTELHIPPSRYLTAHQEREMATRPDLILQLAHRIADDLGPGAEVRVDALASLNGRPPARLIDPNVDLAQERDGFARYDWVLPAPTTRPARLVARTR